MTLRVVAVARRRDPRASTLLLLTLDRAGTRLPHPPPRPRPRPPPAPRRPRDRRPSPSGPLPPRANPPPCAEPPPTRPRAATAHYPPAPPSTASRSRSPRGASGTRPTSGVTLVEGSWPSVGDHLAYRQDVVITEAYLDTARLRTSVRRHARLVDYAMHDGVNARAWVAVCVDTDVTSASTP